MRMENKIIGLVRVSSDRQETESQKNELQNLLKRKGFEPENIIWIEEKASATKSNEKYDNFIADVKQKCLTENIKNIGCWSLNRIGRRETALIDFKQFCISNQIQLYCFEPELMLLNEDGSVNSTASTIYNIWIEFIRSETVEREKKIRRGKAHVREIGRYTGGSLQYGYSVNSEKYLVINPEEASVVQKIFQMYASAEHSVYSIARDLKLTGTTKKDGKVFTGPMIQKILRCENYLGDNTYPAIIEQDLYDKVANILSNNKTKKTKESKRVSLGAGLIRCQCCGRRYFREEKLYICISKKKNGEYTGECESRAINAELLDMLLSSIVVPLHAGFLTDEAKRKEEDIKQEITVYETKIKNLKTDLSSKEKRRDRLQIDFYAGRISNEKVYESALKANQNEIDKINSEIELTSTKISMLEARLNVSKDKQLIDKFRKILQSVARKERIYTRSNDSQFIKELIRMHIKEIKTEWNPEEQKQYLHIELEDGRTLHFRYLLQRGWFNRKCIGQMSVDNSEFKDAIIAEQMRYEERKIWLNFESMQMINDKISDVLQIEPVQQK